MTKIYAKPSLKTSLLKFPPLQGQYQFIITSACPTYDNASNTILFEFTETAFSVCASSCIVPPVNIPPAIVTCSNIEGEFSLQLSQPFAGGGLSCNSGEVSCTITVSISPSLPSDCVLDSLIISIEGQEFDACEGFAG